MEEALPTLPELVPARLQKITVGKDGTVVVEVFAGGKRWLRVDGPGQGGRVSILGERPERDGDDVDQTVQGLLRKELIPGILSDVDVDDTAGLLRLLIVRPEGPARTLVVERDAREPRWLLLAPGDDNERILVSIPGARPTDGRDTRRGRPYEPPRRAPTPPQASTTSTTAPAPRPAVDPAIIALRTRLRAEHERCRRLHKKLQGDLERHGEPERLAADGELLKTMMGRLKRGQSHVDVVDYDGAPRTIVLDPARDARANLQRAFDRARRARAAAAHVKPRLDDVSDRIAGLATMRERLQAEGPASSDVAAAIALLARPDSGPSARRRAAIAGKRQPWRAFAVDGDVVVRVGRGAKDNDALVKSARGHDLWLHARDRTGAHVIIPSTGGPIPEATLVDAAHLAAWFSAGRGERHVDIQHTRVKHLKKPGAGAPAGLFLVSAETVTHLRVDDERVKALLAREVAVA